MHCPRGSWRDKYFSEELKDVVKYGYKVRVLSAVLLDKAEGSGIVSLNICIKDGKERGDEVEELLYKLLQNSLFGKAGQKEIINSFKLINNDKVKLFELKNKTDIHHVFGDKTIIRTPGKIEAEIEGLSLKL